MDQARRLPATTLVLVVACATVGAGVLARALAGTVAAPPTLGQLAIMLVTAAA